MGRVSSWHISLALSTLLLMVACAQPEPTPTPSSAVTRTPTPTPSPTPIPSPTPTPTPVTTPTSTPIPTPMPTSTSRPTPAPQLVPTSTPTPILPTPTPVTKCKYEYPSEPESPRTSLLSAVGVERYYRAPDPQRISLEFDSSTDLGPVRVTGAAGAVQPCDSLRVINLELGDSVTLFADTKGAFEAEVDGVPGTHIVIARHPLWGKDAGNFSPSSILLRLPVQDAGEGL